MPTSLRLMPAVPSLHLVFSSHGADVWHGVWKHGFISVPWFGEYYGGQDDLGLSWKGPLSILCWNPWSYWDIIPSLPWPGKGLIITLRSLQSGESKEASYHGGGLWKYYIYCWYHWPRLSKLGPTCYFKVLLGLSIIMNPCDGFLWR